MRVAGLGGLTVATASVAGGIPLAALAASAQDETPEGFLAYAYAQRAGHDDRQRKPARCAL
jgi:hypothetical protein